MLAEAVAPPLTLPMRMVRIAPFQAVSMASLILSSTVLLVWLWRAAVLAATVVLVEARSAASALPLSPG